MSLFADITDALKDRVQTKSDKVLSILKDTTLDKEVKFKQIDTTISDIFDYKTMALISLGGNGRKLLTKDEKKQFVELFTKHIKKSYFDKSDLLTDKKIIVKEAKKAKSRIFIISDIVSKKETNQLIYKFHKTKSKKWLIYDVEFAGVSIVTSYRKQFEELLKSSNVQKLLDSLK